MLALVVVNVSAVVRIHVEHGFRRRWAQYAMRLRGRRRVAGSAGTPQGGLCATFRQQHRDLSCPSLPEVHRVVALVR